MPLILLESSVSETETSVSDPVLEAARFLVGSCRSSGNGHHAYPSG